MDTKVGLGWAWQKGARKLEVTSIIEGSPSSKSGAKVGDAMVSINGIAIVSQDTARALVSAAVGRVEVLVQRTTYAARLGAGAGSDAGAGASSSTLS